MSNKVNWFKQPDWDYIQKKYPNDYEAIKSYWRGGWSIIDCRPFTEEEMGMINRCKVVPSQYGKSMSFELIDGKLYYVPMYRDYDAEVDHEPSPMELYILTLMNKPRVEDGPIYRITDTPIDIHKKLEDFKAECARLQQIIDEEDTFRGCLKLY
jgi:hypothetical protein